MASSTAMLDSAGVQSADTDGTEAAIAALDEDVRPVTVRRAIDDAPMRSKITLIVLLAATGGVLVGLLQAHAGSGVWVFVIGTMALMAVLMWLCDWWVWSPVDRLVRQLHSIRLRTAPKAIHNLPTSRRDEIGQIARAIEQMAITSLRHEFEAKRVRRTMDARVATATRQATSQLRVMAMRDPLTDLANRRFLEQNLDGLVAAAHKAGEDLICVALDLDNFKKVNDTMGHEAGDELLLFLASILRGCTRREDYAVRLGGDEFLLLLPACGLDHARQVIERIHALFRQHVRNALPAELGADLSLGVASLQRDNLQTGQDLLKQADHNLYLAKHQGKGRLAGA